MSELISLLSQGDMRTTGKVDEVVKNVLRQGKIPAELFSALEHEDPGVRMRSADALEKISVQAPDLLLPQKARLLRIAQKAQQQEVQWHLAQILPRLSLTPAEAAQAWESFQTYYQTSQSKIVRAFTLTAQFLLSKIDGEKSKQLQKMLRDALEDPAPSLRSRARKLIQQSKKV